MKVLIIEDDRQIVEAISLALEIRWPEASVLSSHLGEKGIDMVETEDPDVIIMDLGLPDISGFEVLKRIRLFSNVPVLILSVRSEESDVVRGLELGADDYLTKPFKQLELLARIKALLRRSATGEDRQVTVGDLTYDVGDARLTRAGQEISLTRTEGTMMLQLMKHAGRVVSHADFAEALWGTSDYPEAADSLKVYIRRLREKLEEDPGQPRLILNRPGLGYYLSKPE